MEGNSQRSGALYIGFGVLLIIAAFFFIFQTAGIGLRGVKPVSIDGMEVKTVPDSPVDLANNNKIIYTEGTPVGSAELQDPLIGISVKAIKIIRVVEMYQWIETQDSKKEQLKNSIDKETVVYTYKPVWSDALIDSNSFKDKLTYPNPLTMPVDGLRRIVAEVKVGDYVLPKELIDLMTTQTQVDLSGYDLDQMQTRSKTKIFHDGKSIYAGDDVNSPKIGDIRISLYQVAPTDVSIIARQMDANLYPLTTSDGKKVAYLLSGRYTAKQMIEMNSLINPWIYFIAMLIIICIGVFFILKSLDVNSPLYLQINTYLQRTGFYPFVVISGLMIWALAMFLVYCFIHLLVAVLFLAIIAAGGFALHKLPVK